MLNLLRPARPSPLLPLQISILLRPQLPEDGLEDPPQCLRTQCADDVLCTGYSQLLQSYQPDE
jgi:hypothetical protein